MTFKFIFGCLAGLALGSMAWASEAVETFESSGFTNHTVIDESRATDLIVVAVESGGSSNMKEVMGPAAIFVGFDPSNPVTELSIKRVDGQPFNLSRLTLTNQFEMIEEIRIRAFRSGALVGDFSAEVPWPTADISAPTGSSFDAIDEVRLSATDLYFYLEDVGLDLEPGAGSSDAPSAEPIPLFGSWLSILVMVFMLAAVALNRQSHKDHPPTA